MFVYMKTLKKVAIFKTGTHKSSAGNEETYKVDDLDTIVKKFNESERDVPLCAGHPKDNSPAYGWVDSLYREGKTLFADFRDVADGMISAIENKQFKNRSISFYKDFTPRHVALLGGAQPAVAGLPEFSFSDGDEKVVEITSDFMEWDEAYNFRTIGEMFREIKNWIIGEKGKDEADKIITEYGINSLVSTRATEKTGDVSPSFSEGDSEMKELEEAKAKIADLEGKVSSFSEQITAKDGEIAKLKADADNQKAVARKEEHKAFCQKLIEDGKMLPAEVDASIDQLEIAHAASQGRDFAEGTKSPYDSCRDLFANRQKVVEFGEFATSGKSKGAGATTHDFGENVDPERLELHTRAVEFAEKNSVSYIDAVTAVMNQ